MVPLVLQGSECLLFWHPVGGVRYRGSSSWRWSCGFCDINIDDPLSGGDFWTLWRCSAQSIWGWDSVSWAENAYLTDAFRLLAVLDCN